MTTIESKKVEIGRQQSEVFKFIRNLRNLEQLLPQERISEFEGDDDSCSFKIQGMATIGLKVSSEVANEKLILKSTDAPFPFTLDIRIEENDAGCSAYNIAEVDLNPMMKMMVEKPLKNLFDHISDRLKAVHS